MRIGYSLPSVTDFIKTEDVNLFFKIFCKRFEESSNTVLFQGKRVLPLKLLCENMTEKLTGQSERSQGGRRGFLVERLLIYCMFKNSIEDKDLLSSILSGVESVERLTSLPLLKSIV